MEWTGATSRFRRRLFTSTKSIARYAMVVQQRLRDPEPVTELELNAIAHLLSAQLVTAAIPIWRARPMSRVDQKLSSAELRTVTDYIEAHLDSALRLSETGGCHRDESIPVCAGPFRLRRETARTST